jgi:hypothetical protein
LGIVVIDTERRAQRDSTEKPSEFGYDESIVHNEN